ncbi:unnamed protein product [Symbiodinium sp. CCMP2456]|nr:unnamed protein product [Symbiodinium sp. CCMP2456]
MARSGRVAVPVLLCLGLVAFVSQSSVFVPAPQSNNRLPAAAAVAAPALLAGAPAAFADAIGDAAAKFSDATYPIAEKINWGNTPIISSYFATESARNPKAVAQAVDTPRIGPDYGSQPHQGSGGGPRQGPEERGQQPQPDDLEGRLCGSQRGPGAHDRIRQQGQVLQAFGRLPGQQAAADGPLQPERQGQGAGSLPGLQGPHLRGEGGQHQRRQRVEGGAGDRRPHRRCGGQVQRGHLPIDVEDRLGQLAADCQVPL